MERFNLPPHSWAPDRTGYTTDLVQVGRYSRAEAIDICHDALPRHSRPALPFPEVPAREDDDVATLSHGARDLELSLR